MRLWSRSLLFWVLRASGFFYASPANFNYWYNFGILAFYFLMSQIVTGILLAMFYNPNVALAFVTIININNEIYFGWWIRCLHANGASWFFFVVYIHIFRGIYYGSFAYPRQLLWVSGVIIWFLMIATAFLGYVLPWGQMSFWGAMVITSLLGAIPLVGPDILFLLWGGYSIDDITLHRFYSLHFTLPFIILAVAILHMFFLHEFGSSNPMGISSRLDNIPFLPYYGIKDLYSIVIVWLIFFYIIFMYPDWLGHPDNYNIANALVTPAHIVPEWYFLPLYAVLRSVTDKLLGIFLIACFVVTILILPFFLKNIIIRSGTFKPLFAFLFWFFVMDCLLLGWIGSLPVISPYLEIGQFLTVAYFSIVFILFPLNNFFEKLVYDVYVWRGNLVLKFIDGTRVKYSYRINPNY